MEEYEMTMEQVAEQAELFTAPEFEIIVGWHQGRPFMAVNHQQLGSVEFCVGLMEGDIS